MDAAGVVRDFSALGTPCAILAGAFEDRALRLVLETPVLVRRKNRDRLGAIW